MLCCSETEQKKSLSQNAQELGTKRIWVMLSVVHSLIPGSELQLDKARNKTRLDSASKGFEITGFDLL